MTRSELILFALDHGYRISEAQIERWHKKGILPAPKRLPSTGNVGSAWEYPSNAQENLLLILTSEESKRSLDKLLIDVWIRGGLINPKHLRQLLNNLWLKPFGKFFKYFGGSLWIEKIEKFIKNPSNKKRLFPYVSLEDFQTTLILIVNALSPSIKDVLWHESIIDNMGEDGLSEIADKAIGADFLRSLDLQNKETSEDMFDDIHKLLNLNALEEAVVSADAQHFTRAQKDLPLLELYITFLREAIVFLDKTNALVRMINSIAPNSYALRTLGLIVLLRVYQDKRANQWPIDLISSIKNNIENMEVTISFIEYMKKHPKLKKRIHWNSYFKQCDEITLQSIKAHAETYMNEHPEFIPLIEQLKSDAEVI